MDLIFIANESLPFCVLITHPHSQLRPDPSENWCPHHSAQEGSEHVVPAPLAQSACPEHKTQSEIFYLRKWSLTQKTWNVFKLKCSKRMDLFIFLQASQAQKKVDLIFWNLWKAQTHGFIFWKLRKLQNHDFFLANLKELKKLLIFIFFASLTI